MTAASFISARDFEGLYRAFDEPWHYHERAAEVLRHEWVLRAARRLEPDRLLDLGCSLGQLTGRLASLPAEVWGVDIAPTAVARARRLLPRTSSIQLAAGSAMDLPFASSSFDLVIACDGLYSWELNATERRRAVCEIRRTVHAGGYALFSEHTRPHRFEEFIDEIAAGGFRILSVRYLYDRPWYQFESWFASVRGMRPTRQLLGNRHVAQGLQAVGRVFGRTASRHVCVLAKPEAPSVHR